MTLWGASMNQTRSMCLLVALFIGAYSSTAGAQMTAQMRASTLLGHCTKSSEPDGFCLGYMEAALDFITEYQLWMTLNRYEYPPKDKPICVSSRLPAREAANVFVGWMKSHDVGWTAANAGVGDAVRNAYACKK